MSKLSYFTPMLVNNSLKTVYRQFVLVLFVVFASASAHAQTTVGYDGVDELWSQAQELVTKKVYGPASIKLEQFIARTNNQSLKVQAQYWLAHCHLKNNDPVGLKELDEFMVHHPESQLISRAKADKAVYYYDQKDYGRVTEVVKVSDFNSLPEPDRSEAIFKLAYSHLTRRQFGKADTLFNQIRENDHAYTAAANYYSGYLSVKNNRLEPAIRSLEKAERDSAYSKMTPLLRTVIYYRNKKWDQAIAAGEKYLADTSKVSGSDELTRLVAESYYNKSKYADAAKYYERYLALNPGNNTKSLRYRIGYAHFMAQNYEKAVDQFTKVIAMTPDSLLKKDSTAQYAHYYGGVAYIKLDNKAFAVANFDKARQSSANASIQETSWYIFAKLLYEQEKFDDAIAALKDFDAKYPNSKLGPDAPELITEALLNSNNYDEALKYIFSVKKRSPRVDRAFQRVNYLKGLALYNQSRFKDAAEYLESALKINEDTSIYAASALLAGESLLQTKKYQDAISRFKLAGRWGGALPYYRFRSRYGEAYALFNLKQYDKAGTAFNDLLRVIDTADQKEKTAEAMVRIADCYYVRKQYKQADQWYDKALTLGAFDADYAAYQKGVVESLTGDSEAAMASFDYLAKTYLGSPYRDMAMFQKANILFDKSQYQQSIEAFTDLIKQGGSANVMPLALLRRAQANNNLKNYNEAAEDYKRIIDEYAISKQADDAILGLQEAAGHTGQTEELQAYLTKFKAANPESKSSQGVEFETAKTLFFNQKYDGAIAAFKAFTSAYEGSPLALEANYYLGESYFRKNDRANSISYHTLVLNEPANALYNKSLTRLADLSLSGGDFDKARRYFALLADKAKSKKEAVNAKVGQMEAYFGLGKSDSVLILANVIMTTPGTPQDAVNKAQLNRGKVALANNELDKAMDDLLTVVNNAKDVSGAEAMYYVADIQAKQSKFNESIETLFDLNKTYSGYPKWYDKSFLLIADNYMALGKTQLARYTLQNLIDKSPNPTIRNEAKAKIELIK